MANVLVSQALLTALNDAISERDAEIEQLRAELAGVIEGHKAAVELWQQQDYNNSAKIERLRQQVDAWQATGNAIMLCAVGREAPLSDSDVCGEINALRQQVAELQATVKKWNDVGTGILFFLNGRPGMDSYAMESFVDSLPKQVIGAMGYDPYEGTTVIRLSDIPD